MFLEVWAGFDVVLNDVVHEAFWPYPSLVFEFP